ncbi:unnamed protein product [[Candida] boidinii]|nr:unnamed protein product [[Candida] boidinii]
MYKKYFESATINDVEFTTSESPAASTPQVPTSTSEAESTITSKPSETKSTNSEISSTLTTTIIEAVTSCDNDICHEEPVTMLLTTATTTISGVETVYTTYCPETEIETSSSTISVSSSKTKASKGAETAVNLITDQVVTANIETQQPSLETFVYTTTISGVPVVLTTYSFAEPDTTSTVKITETDSIHTSYTTKASNGTETTIAPIDNGAVAVARSSFVALFFGILILVI